MDKSSQHMLTILLIEDDKHKAQLLINALSSSHYSIEHVVNTGISLLKEVERLQPDLIIIDIESPNRDMLDSLHFISDANPKPIVMFAEQDSQQHVSELIKAGVSAYVSGGVDSARLKSILDTAVARFSEYQQLKKELKQTKQKLSNQKHIEKAKIWLMETKSITEQEAYHRIRKMAMDNSQKIEDVAKNILSLAQMLEKSL